MFGIKDTPKTRSILAVLALISGAIGIYLYLQIPTQKPRLKTPYNYTDNELIGLIRGSGDRCKEPAIVTPTTIPNGTNYLVACNIGTHEITITQGSEPIVKTLKFN